MATNKAQDQTLQESAVSASEKFINENKKTIWTVVIAAVAVGLCILGYTKFIYEPACAEASSVCYNAELSFQAGEYQLALEGDGVNAGFAEVVESYGAKAGKAVYLYAGICEMKLGNDEAALDYLKHYCGKDAILSARAIALQGDANANLGNYEKAAKLFRKAAAKADNIFAANYLLKAGIAYEALEQPQEALKCYEVIKDKYLNSIEGYEIEMYIARVKAQL